MVMGTQTLYVSVSRFNSELAKRMWRRGHLCRLAEQHGHWEAVGEIGNQAAGDA